MRRLKFILLALFCLFAYVSKATHIVGGEFELVHIKDYQYELRLIQYFDEVNGTPEAEDNFADVYMYAKRDEVLKKQVRLNRVSSEFVKYTNSECADGFVVTRKILYSATIELPPGDFNDEAGYFVVYERCCRNNIISNIVSPQSTGQTFYMEFPAVTSNNQPFVNSSPVLSPPVSDYACINQMFYYDFRSTDPDGDSLVYSLAVPFNSSTGEALPRPAGAPKKEVTFIDGISVENMVPGTPALEINAAGRLTVKPDEPGVFVFSVKVEEFRDGNKIGEIRRDFQMLVVDCNPGIAPVVAGKVKGAGILYNENEIIRFGENGARCLELFVTDQDPDERITIKAEGVNFDEDIQHLIPSSLNLLNGAQDTLKFDLCLPECPYTQGPMIIDVIAFDNACSQPLSDTLRLTIEYEGPENEDPFIVNNPNVVNVELNAGDIYELPIQGIDNDGDQLSLTASGEGFDLDDYGMSLIEELLIPGEVKKIFRWDADCALYNFKDQNEFTVFITLSDNSDCSFGEPDVLKLRLKVNTPVNNRPKISFEGLDSSETTIRIGELLNFNVIAEDKDGDFIRLSAVGEGFDLIYYNMNFPGNTGLQKISAPFSWRLSCNIIDLGERSQFTILFIAEDQNQCSEVKTDTVSVTINVLPPINEPPTTAIKGLSNDTIRTAVGIPVFFTVEGVDPDGDIVTLRLAKVVKDGVELDREVVNFSFVNVRAVGAVSSFFSWTPDCAALTDDLENSFFEISFVAEDDKCFNAKSDTVHITIQVLDRPLNLDSYEPANAFTPNEDGFGDYFHLPTLPQGNCNNRFEKIEIYSRWGNLVFSAEDIDFKWYARGVSSGVYYYLVYYTKQIYKNEVYVHLPEFE